MSLIDVIRRANEEPPPVPVTVVAVETKPQMNTDEHR
jgi:hypothetical protein